MQRLLSPEAEIFLKRQFRRIFDTTEKTVLDVGCGPLSPLPLPNGIIVGVDINHDYIKRYIIATERLFLSNNNKKRNICFGCVCSAASLPFNDNIFDESRCIGMLHHLDGESVLSTIKEMIRCTRPGGRIIIFDSVIPEIAIFRPLAWLSCHFDRGKFMLKEKELLEIINVAYGGNWQHWRFTYTFTGLEGILAIISKKENG